MKRNAKNYNQTDVMTLREIPRLPILSPQVATSTNLSRSHNQVSRASEAIVGARPGRDKFSRQKKISFATGPRLWDRGACISMDTVEDT